MLLCADDLEVPRENLGEGAAVARSFPGQSRVGVVNLPDLPIDVLDIAIGAAACGSPQHPLWPETCERLGLEFTPSQWADLAVWATSLMPDFGLPSEAHHGLFKREGADVLNTRMGAFHSTPWSYGITQWFGEEGTHMCIVAIHRTFMRAEARVSEIYHLADDDCNTLASLSAHLAKSDLIKRLLRVAISQRRHLTPDDRVGASWRPIP